MRALFTFAAALFAAAAAAQPAGERLLFDNPDYDVLVAEDYYCEQPVRLTVRSKIPELFQADSPELQRIVDGARAVLSFECPTVRGVEIEGVLAGLGEPVYFGVAGPDSGWALTTKQSIQSEEYGAYQPPADSGPESSGGGFSVASLAAGMTVDEARAATADAFGVEPAYDARTGVLSMQAGGCPADYDWDAMSPAPEPGWKCLQAWFTDQRQGRLYLMDLVQVIRPADPGTVERQLVERFGEPAARGSRERGGGWGDEAQTIRTIGWGQVVEAGGGEQPDVHNLQAQILPVEGATVVTVTLYEPGLRPRQAAEPAPDAPDLTL